MRYSKPQLKAMRIGVIACGLVFLFACAQQDKFYSNVLRSDVFYQLYETRQVDFLWVFDNSDSMTERREYVKDNMRSFLNILNSRKAVDYQMAVVTTDYFDYDEKTGLGQGRGNLVRSPSGLEVIKSTSADPVLDFASVLNNVQDTATSFWEQGLENAYQAVFRHKEKISRKGVPLVLVFLTDEQDWSCQDNCFGIQPEDNTDWIPWGLERCTKYFQTVKTNENTDLVAFPIVGMPQSECEVASAGTRYIDLQKALGGYGTSGSICNDSEQSYKNIAQTIADRGAKFYLSKISNGRGIDVYVDGERIPYSPEYYEYDEESNAVLFTGALPKNGAIVEISYSEKTD